MAAEKLKARTIADGLLRKLKAGDLEKIGIDEIRQAIAAIGLAGNDRFEEMVTREVVSRV